MNDSAILPKKALFRLDEVASFLGVHPQTVRRWRDEGVINGTKITSRTLRFSRSEVIRVINTRKDNE